MELTPRWSVNQELHEYREQNSVDLGFLPGKRQNYVPFKLFD